MLGNFFMLLMPSDDFFQNQLLKKFSQEHYQSVKWFGFRSGQTFWVQAVCNSYQQMTKIAASKERVNETVLLGAQNIEDSQFF